MAFRIIFILILLGQVSRAQENQIWLSQGFYLTGENTDSLYYFDFNQKETGLKHISIFDYSDYNEDIRYASTWSSVCDKNGTLQFSVLGKKIFDRNFSKFPSRFVDESLFTEDSSLSKGIQHFIVKKPKTNTHYYIISLTNNADFFHNPTTIVVTEVNMSLSGGMGDINPGGKMKKLADSFIVITVKKFAKGMKATVTKGNCNEYWILFVGNSISEEPADLKFYAFRIHEAGFSANPVVTALNIRENGAMNISPDGNQVAISSKKDLFLYDFNKSTGHLENVKLIDSSKDPGFHFAEILDFSKDNRILFAESNEAVIQYDITQPGEDAIRSSKTITYYKNDKEIVDFKVGEDNHLYLSLLSPVNLNGQQLYNLNQIVQIKNIDRTGINDQLQIHILKSMLNAHFIFPPSAAVWHEGDVRHPPQEIHICSESDTVVLSGHPDARSYTWSTGATTESITGIPGHTYWVRSEICDAIYHDTFILQVTPQAERGINTIENEICAGAFLTLKANGEPDAHYVWTNERGDTLGTKDSLPISIYYPGSIYLQETTPLACTYSDSISFLTTPCCEVLIPTSFSPNGDGLNDRFGIVAEADKQVGRFHIYNRYGQLVFKGHNAMETWDGTSGGVPAATGTYFFMIQYRCYGNDETLHTRKGEVTLIR